VVADAPEISPCSAQVAVQLPGVTWTTKRRRQSAQYRGGSSFRARMQAEWLRSRAASPQYPHHM
jgi:hypothetical protein